MIFYEFPFLFPPMDSLQPKQLRWRFKGELDSFFQDTILPLRQRWGTHVSPLCYCLAAVVGGKNNKACRNVLEKKKQPSVICFGHVGVLGSSLQNVNKSRFVVLFPPRVPASFMTVQLSLSDLQGYNGRILMSLAGELLDVTAGAEMYGPGNGYSILAGHGIF